MVSGIMTLSLGTLMTPRWSSKADKVLLEARLQIENAPIIENDPRLYAPLYQNVYMFKRSYELTENTLKVYVYKEGKRPIVHTIAQLFYLPFSSRMLEETLYVPDSHSHKNLIQYLKSYVDMIAAKYPFWNRTEGVDHFLAAFHDWGFTSWTSLPWLRSCSPRLLYFIWSDSEGCSLAWGYHFCCGYNSWYANNWSVNIILAVDIDILVQFSFLCHANSYPLHIVIISGI